MEGHSTRSPHTRRSVALCIYYMFFPPHSISIHLSSETILQGGSHMKWGPCWMKRDTIKDPKLLLLFLSSRRFPSSHVSPCVSASTINVHFALTYELTTTVYIAGDAIMSKRLLAPQLTIEWDFHSPHDIQTWGYVSLVDSPVSDTAAQLLLSRRRWLENCIGQKDYYPTQN